MTVLCPPILCDHPLICTSLLHLPVCMIRPRPKSALVIYRMRAVRPVACFAACLKTPLLPLWCSQPSWISCFLVSWSLRLIPQLTLCDYLVLLFFISLFVRTFVACSWLGSIVSVCSSFLVVTIYITSEDLLFRTSRPEPPFVTFNIGTKTNQIAKWS